VKDSLRRVQAVRYVTPLREGGSLPAIIEADDGRLYVLKFRGAGQGVNVLVAEVVMGEIVRLLGLPVPELVLVDLDGALAAGERDPEIQGLITASVGTNLGMAYLSGALAFEPLLTPGPDAALASAIVWCDAYLTNVDRTPRNPNMLIWQDQLWLIDHGAALYVHYSWPGYQARIQSRFPQIRDHTLLRLASTLPQTDAALCDHLTAAVLADVLALVPDEWLSGGTDEGFDTPAACREAYHTYLTGRLAAPRAFVQEAEHAHATSL
jgi:hypothetical protein